MKLHAVNVVEGGIPTDKRKKVSVRIVLVQARDKEHALEEAAKGFASRLSGHFKPGSVPTLTTW